MQLKKIYLDAYRSLLNTELEIADSCIGLVGSNESGKTNILRAISKLSAANPMTIADTPKMAKKNPQVRFEFHLDNAEQKDISTQVAEWLGNEKIPGGLLAPGFKLIYHVTFDRKALEEKRFFTIDDILLPPGTLVLKSDALTDSWQFRKGDVNVPLHKAILVTMKDLETNIQLIKASEELSRFIEQVGALETEIEELERAKKDSEKPGAQDEPTQEQDSSEELVVAKPRTIENTTIERKRSELNNLIKQRDELEKEIGPFDVEQMLSETESDLAASTISITDINLAINASNVKIVELQEIEELTEVQKQELAVAKKALQIQQAKLQKAEESRKDLYARLSALRQPLPDKYSSEPENLASHLGNLLMNVIGGKLPKVVLWQYSDEFILKGETEFQTIMKAKSLDEISRPLVNLFRIALDIKEIDQLRTIIAEIQGDAGERRRYEAKLDKRINDYIRSVWKDYDQRIKISLEQERILVQFYDPKCDFASYFEMQERSQGCQTFISFLLTIGAEAKQGIIHDTILLLDEPETHLHPSGVRFMLQELIKAAQNGNKVIFATHSIFMIDRDCYNRHAIVTKQKELTEIQPSCRDRIGFFMQEEVLYFALDIDLKKDFDSTNRFNFVFEGDGDAMLFQHYYDFLGKNERPYALESTSFYQGGKCSDIQKYFSNRPIQLGSTWVFILDSDTAANELRKFLEGKYKNFLNSYIFVFQYERDGWSHQAVEFEDLLPVEIIISAILDGANAVEAQNADELHTMIDGTLTFDEYFKKISTVLVTTNNTGFKGAVKSALNSKIIETVAKAKKSDFSNTFPVYIKWAAGVVDSLKSTGNIQKKTKEHNIEESPGFRNISQKKVGETPGKNISQAQNLLAEMKLNK